MVEENIINEFAVIFNRQKIEHNLIEQFIPVKVVEGYYNEDIACFIDADQNVYPHISSLTNIGNVFAARINIIQTLSEFNDMSLKKIKEEILLDLSQYDFYKNIDEESEDYCQIRIYNKETGELSIFCDKNTAQFNENDENDKMLITSSSIEINDKQEINITPKDIANEIKKTIKGQDEAIAKIATLIWTKYNMPKINKTNMLVVGASGVGKTTIFKKIKEKLDIPLSIYPLSSTLNGYEIEEMLLKLYYDSDMDIDKTENGIIVIDNFEEICSDHSSDELAKFMIQNELLKIISGCEKVIPLDEQTIIKINTAKITFICCGNFLNKKSNDITIGFSTKEQEKQNNSIDTNAIINNSGIISELIECLPIIIELEDKSKNREVLKDILLNSDDSAFHQLAESFAAYGIKISNFDLTVDYLVDTALKKGYGVQKIINTITNMLLNVIEKIGNNPNKYNKLIIGNNIIDDANDYKLVQKRIKVKKKGNINQN